MNRFLCRPVGIALLTFLLVALDQATKGMAVQYLKGQDPFVIWKGVFEFRYLENRGGAFGIFQGQRVFFLFTGVIVLIAVFYVLRHMSREARYWPLRLIAVGILSGAWGNMIDRLRLSYVVDFFYFKLIDFPIFNVADIYVSVGTAVLVVLVLFYYKDEELSRLLTKKGSDNS